jgi:peptide/nickel transport system permease protein
MPAYLLGRLTSLVLSLLVASLVIFLVTEVIPGDPAAFMLGLNADPAAVAALREQMGLNDPLPVRYLAWAGGMLTGDFGTSLTYRVPVSELVAARLWISLPLTIYALILSTLIAIPVGLIAAARRGQSSDVAIMSATQLGIAVPNFWFAMILVLIFAIQLRWFSAGGFPGWEMGFWPNIKALTLPAIALALPQASILARVMRSSVLETLGQDYIRTARAKGLTRGRIILRHALPNAILPVIAMIGIDIGIFMGGIVVVESVFGWPGIGQLAWQAIQRVDIPIIMGVTLISACAIVIGNLLADLIAPFIDPRIKLR